ncbi:hypothetical protein Mycsm_02233 [Mycobacterium sp. JS623]|nr:hypothetical protein Mycsm_02233 [Mycobacterium sp. JS623]
MIYHEQTLNRTKYALPVRVCVCSREKGAQNDN